MLVVRRPRETFDKCLEAFILTAANVACFTLLRVLLESIPRGSTPMTQRTVPFFSKMLAGYEQITPFTIRIAQHFPGQGKRHRTN